MNAGPDVFVSYTRDLQAKAEELTGELARHGIRTWVDWTMSPGQNFKEELDRAVARARFLLILVAPHSGTTTWQEAEWSAALSGTWRDSDKLMLPIVFGPGDPPPFLRNWVALRVDPETDAATWTRKVLDVLRNPPREASAPVRERNRAERLERLEEIRRAAEASLQLEASSPSR